MFKIFNIYLLFNRPANSLSVPDNTGFTTLSTLLTMLLHSGLAVALQDIGRCTDRTPLKFWRELSNEYLS